MISKKFLNNNFSFVGFVLLLIILVIVVLIIINLGKKKEKIAYNYGCGDDYPVIGVVGGSGKSLCVDIISDVMRDKYKVGKLNQQGVSVDNQWKQFSALTVDEMRVHHSIDAAVVCLSTNVIKESALGLNKCDVGIFLNNKDPYKTMEYYSKLYEQICQNGCAILNCDDDYYYYLKKIIPMMRCKIIFFSHNKNSDLLKEATQKNYPNVYFENNKIIFRDKNNKHIFSLKDNYRKRNDIEATMAAIACCMYMNLDIDRIKERCNCDYVKVQ
jgi:UDP-N-acetylmuramyl pentapeptide synthase